MKLREQASLSCKILALLCVVLALGTLQNSVPQTIGSFVLGMRGGSSLNASVLLFMCAPATLMGLFGVALWGVSPFIASLMVSDETVAKFEDDAQIVVSNFGARAAMKIALIVLGLWLFVQGSIGAGMAMSLRTIISAYSGTATSGNASIAAIYQYQSYGQMMGAALHFVLGILFLILSGPISRRVFPN